MCFEAMREMLRGLLWRQTKAHVLGEVQSADFWQLGLGDPFPVSGIHGSGMGDLMEELGPARVRRRPELRREPREPQPEPLRPSTAALHQGHTSVGRSCPCCSHRSLWGHHVAAQEMCGGRFARART